jgi:hypothetical protein
MDEPWKVHEFRGDRLRAYIDALECLVKNDNCRNEQELQLMRGQFMHQQDFPDKLMLVPDAWC